MNVNMERFANLELELKKAKEEIEWLKTPRCHIYRTPTNIHESYRSAIGRPGREHPLYEHGWNDALRLFKKHINNFAFDLESYELK